MLSDRARVSAIVALVPLVSAISPTFSPGEAVSAVFPPPNLTETFDASTAFPGPNVVGFPGPTATGDEAEAVATAPVPGLLDSYYPLTGPGTFGHKFNVLGRFGNLAPWQSVSSNEFGLPGASPHVPDGYKLESVHLWHRHGARYAAGTSNPGLFAAKLYNTTVHGNGFNTTGSLKFLNEWTYKLGAEILTPFGRKQMFDLGADFRIKYGALLKESTALPVFRTESQDRMVHSSLNFAAGFFGIPYYKTDYHQVIVIEAPGFNNSGAPYDTCVNSNRAIGNFGSNQTAIWKETYLRRALARLQPQIDGVNLTTADIFAMQEACAYETVALGYSAFCELFTESEWDAFQYNNDLNFHYNSGFGSPVAVAQGMALVQELVARLTHTRIATHNSTTNSTIDDSDITMPLNQSIYVDATHDVVISNFIVALNMTSLAPKWPPPADHIPENRPPTTAQVVPFGTNIVAQVLSCAASKTGTPSYIRFILNDGVLPMTGIKGCKYSPHGLCELEAFISAMKEQIAGVDFAFDCLANYTIAEPTKITDGRPPPSVRPTHH